MHKNNLRSVLRYEQSVPELKGFKWLEIKIIFIINNHERKSEPFQMLYSVGQEYLET